MAWCRVQRHRVPNRESSKFVECQRHLLESGDHQKKPTTGESEFVLLVYGPPYEACRSEDIWEADSGEMGRMLDNADSV